MIEDIIKIQDFNNASTVEQRRASVHAQRKNEIGDNDRAELKGNRNIAELKGERNIKDAMDKISSIANLYNRKIRLEVEKDLNIMIVKVIDGDTEEVIRQIPSEELVALSKHAKDLKGLLINKEG